MRVKIWGARGSLPSPVYPEIVEAGLLSLFKDFFARGYSKETDIGSFFLELPRHRFGGYGGNTPCVEVSQGSSRLLIDGGSGIRALGNEMMKGELGRGQGQVHIFMTHFHWDHLIGLPFFTPIFVPGNEIHIYAVQPELPDIFEAVFKKPFFPVPLKDIGASLIYHRLEPRKPMVLGEMTITPYQLDHPDPCWGYRITGGCKVYAHCVDTECSRASPEALGLDLPLYQGVDLMAFDAQYTLVETLDKVNWGHAAASLGLDIAIREGVKRVLFMHHDPSSSAEKIAAAEAQARRYYESLCREASVPLNEKKSREFEWSFAYDGQVVEL